MIQHHSTHIKAHSPYEATFIRYVDAWRKGSIEALTAIMAEGALITTQIDAEVSVYHGIDHDIPKDISTIKTSKIKSKPFVLVQNKEEFAKTCDELEQSSLTHYTVLKSSDLKKNKLHIRTVSAEMTTDKKVSKSKRKGWEFVIEFEEADPTQQPEVPPLIKSIYQMQFIYAA
jgi:hypothetical protein